MLLNIGIVLSDLGQDWLIFLKKSLIHDVIKCIHLINSNEREKVYGFNITIKHCFLTKILNCKQLPFAMTVKEVAVYPTLFSGLFHSTAGEEIWKQEQKERNIELNLGNKNNQKC